MIYLDHNATSPLRPEAEAATTAALAVGGNPSSIHAVGRKARAAIEEARDAVAKLARARVEDVVFTSGGTEANALALWGAIYGALEAEERITRLFISAIEHPSVRDTATAIGARVPGVRVLEIPVTTDGLVDTEALRAMLREGKGRTLVAVMAANNETGVVQPLDLVTKHVRDAGALLLVDAVQAAGKIPFAFDADYLTVSSHKLGGPQGTGALILKESAPFAPLVSGGGQERGRRGGTENVAGIAGFGAAAAIAAKLDDVERRAHLRDEFEAEFLRRWPGVIVFGKDAPRLCNTSSFAVLGVTAENALMALDLDGICVSSGSACSSGKVKHSAVLAAMGVNDEIAGGALRVSFGWNSVEGDVEALLSALDRFIARASRAAA